jgi:hypothetical protein
VQCRLSNQPGTDIDRALSDQLHASESSRPGQDRRRENEGFWRIITIFRMHPGGVLCWLFPLVGLSYTKIPNLDGYHSILGI